MKTILSIILVALTAGTATATDKMLWQPFRITPRTGSQHISLDGEWQLSWRDTAINNPAQLQTQTNAFAAQVPSSVQWAVYRTGKFPHPYEHLNSKLYAWVDEKIWYYKRSFELPKSDQNSYIFLCFDGIDYFSRVWVNGTLLGQHEGMFGGPMIDVSRFATLGAKNEVLVEVKAGNYGNKKGWKSLGPEGTVIKPWVIAAGLGGEMFFPLGMWQSARVEIVPRDHLERPFLATLEANEKEARLALSLEVLTGTNSLPTELHPWKNRQIADGSRSWVVPPPTREKFSLLVSMVEKDSGRTAIKKTFALNILEGRNFAKEEIDLPKPRLWWPNGLGSQPLYRVKLTLIRDGQETDSAAFDYGIRTIQTKPSTGPRTTDRWANWQFIINGRPIFVKGMNWMPADILLDLPRERYRWLLGAARAAGIQLLRVWGGGLVETEEFYETCNEMGIMVWQDFPIGNRATPEWPQDVWEAQVMQTIFRLRNHPSLALWCGGNEFNPYATGNATSIGIFERCLADFDPTRPMRRTSPDAGSLHTYPDMDPTWYGQIYRLVPFLSETGMHSIPDPASIREVVDKAEVDKPLTGMLEKTFPAQHPELMHHFVEYQASRVPRMLSRASHIADMSNPTLEKLSEGTQIGAGEFYQIVSEQMQANYPITTGLMPWVFKRPWPVIAIMLVDGFGHPTAPYYFLKRTYESTHIMANLPWLVWAKGEKIPLKLQVLHAAPEARDGVSASVAVYNELFVCVAKKKQQITVDPGPSVTTVNLGEFEIPQPFEDKFFFIVTELQDAKGNLMSRSVYWPRCLSAMSDDAFRTKYRTSPQPSMSLDKGPWLKPQVRTQQTTLSLSLQKKTILSADRVRLRLLVKNTGDKPAFLTQFDIKGEKRAFYSTDNFFWLPAGEEKHVEIDILWRTSLTSKTPTCTVGAWNANTESLNF